MSPYIIPGIKRKQITPADKIIKEVCRYFELTPEAIKVRTRKREIVNTRQYSMYFLKLNTGLSLKSIGTHFGEKPYDHTSVLHSIRTINDSLSIKDEVTMRDIAAIKNILN